MDLVEIFKFLDSLEDKVGQHILCCDENRFKGDYYAIKIISNKKDSRGIRCEVVGFDRKGEININKFLGWLFNGIKMKHEELVEAYYSCENKKEQFEYLIFTEVYKNMDRVNYYFCHFNNFSDKYKSGALMAGTIYLCNFVGGELVVGASSKYFEIRNGHIYDDREYYFCKGKEHAESIIDSMHHIG